MRDIELGLKFEIGNCTMMKCDSRLRRGRLVLAPDTGEGGLNFLLEAGNQLPVGGDQRLLGFYLSDDGLLRGESRWQEGRDSNPLL